jgi:hypothetical protein
LKQLTTQKNKIETQLEKLEERFAIGETGQNLYQKYTQIFSDELIEIDQKLDFGQNGSSSLGKVTEEVIKVSKNLFSTSLDMSYDQKYEFQKFASPKGATYIKKNDRFRALKIYLLIELTKRNTGLYENKKSGTLSQNEMNSALVDISVLISNFYIFL